MKKVLLVMSIILVLTFAMATVAYATGASPAPSPTNSVANVIVDGFGEVKNQTKTIFFDVVVWALRAIAVIVLIVFIATAGISKHKGESINFAPIIITLVVLILLIVIPEAAWKLIG